MSKDPTETAVYRKQYRRLIGAGLTPAVAHLRAEAIAKQAAASLARMVGAQQLTTADHLAPPAPSHPCRTLSTDRSDPIENFFTE